MEDPDSCEYDEESEIIAPGMKEIWQPCMWWDKELLQKMLEKREEAHATNIMGDTFDLF